MSLEVADCSFDQSFLCLFVRFITLLEQHSDALRHLCVWFFVCFLCERHVGCVYLLLLALPFGAILFSLCPRCLRHGSVLVLGVLGMLSYVLLLFGAFVAFRFISYLLVTLPLMLLMLLISLASLVLFFGASGAIVT